MTPRFLQAVLRSLADAASPAGDGELLREFAATGGEAAFAELVRRHGRLVWAACRHLSGSEAEAEDAFQATFLVLLRNAGQVRDGAKLSSWLHGVAYRVCSKARLGAKRRAAREQAAAVGERAAPAVPESAWDRAMAAVHEEVAKLPETLRVPFVLCCLEGRGVTEAAEQLGWKLGTFSGRLTRAKDALLARLDARGLTLGVVACVGLAAPPALTAKAVALAKAGVVIPCLVLELARGGVGMSMSSVKMLAAAVVLTCGLGAAGWLGTAGAQPPDKGKVAAEKVPLPGEAEAQKTAKHQYIFVNQGGQLTPREFVDLVQEREKGGWEYLGTTPLKMPSGGQATFWVFRRPRVKAAVNSDAGTVGSVGADGKVRLGEAVSGKFVLNERNFDLTGDDPRVIEAEIKKLQDRLAAMKQAPATDALKVALAGLPLDASDLSDLLKRAALKAKKTLTVPYYDGLSMTIEGDAATLEWAKKVIDRLRDK